MNLLTSSTEEQYHKVPELPLQRSRQLILHNRQQQIQHKMQVVHSKLHNRQLSKRPSRLLSKRHNRPHRQLNRLQIQQHSKHQEQLDPDLCDARATRVCLLLSGPEQDRVSRI